jgi:hypothetical protein
LRVFANLFILKAGIIINMASDIGALLFKEILQMSAYPGAPFTGNIVQDLVMFFFIPTVFIIVIVYSLVGRIGMNNKISLLLGVAFYLFIVFSPYGLYTMFAYLAGPYFLFMLIIMGLIYFVLGHFSRKGGGGGSGASAGGGGGKHMERSAVERAARSVENPYENLGRAHINDEIRKKTTQLHQIEKQIANHRKRINELVHSGKESKIGEDSVEANLEQRRTELEMELTELNEALRRGKIF